MTSILRFLQVPNAEKKNYGEMTNLYHQICISKQECLEKG